MLKFKYAILAIAVILIIASVSAVLGNDVINDSNIIQDTADNNQVNDLNAYAVDYPDNDMGCGADNFNLDDNQSLQLFYDYDSHAYVYPGDDMVCGVDDIKVSYPNQVIDADDLERWHCQFGAYDDDFVPIYAYAVDYPDNDMGCGADNFKPIEVDQSQIVDDSHAVEYQDNEMRCGADNFKPIEVDQSQIVGEE